MTRYPQVKNLDSPAALRSRLAELGLDLPVADRVDAAGPLSRPVTITDGRAGTFAAPNRFAVLPMEGWDGTTAGQPTDLVRRRWTRFAESGAGLVWGEATAVVPEGRANPNQLVVGARTADDLGALRSLLSPDQVVGLQLTHSGRWARPDGTPHPRTAFRHPVLDDRTGASDASVLTDGELEELQGAFVAAAVRVAEAGFDFVDVKCCHGYLLHELLAGRDRPGPFGGDLDGRTRFLRGVLAGIRSRAPGLAVAVRLSAFDFVPYRQGEDGVGEPERDGTLPRPFGADAAGLGIDLTETHELLDLLASEGVGLVCTTAGSPYYNPHIQRPAYFPPSDGYDPPEDPLVGVVRQIAATTELTRAHPDLVIVGSGYSYLQDWLPHVGQEVVAAGGTHLVGLGRMALSYPTLPADLLAGRPLERRLVCRTFSDCTTAPRAGLVSGCYPLDPHYKAMPERVELVQAKRRAKEVRR